MPLVGTDTSDNEDLLYVVLWTGVKAATSMLLKKSLEWIVDDNVWFEAVETLFAGVVETMPIFPISALSCLLADLGQHDRTEPIVLCAVWTMMSVCPEENRWLVL